MTNCTKLGGRSSAIRVGSRLAGLPDNAQGRSSSCPGGLPGLEEDSYLKLRSDFLREFKSMSALFQRCQPAPEVGIGRASADERESTNWHDSIIFRDKFTNTMRKCNVTKSDSKQLALNRCILCLDFDNETIQIII